MHGQKKTSNLIRILDRVFRFTPRPLDPQGKVSLYKLDMKLRGPRSQTGRHWGGKSICHSRASNLDPTVVQLVSCHYTDNPVSKAIRKDANTYKPILKGYNKSLRQASLLHKDTVFSRR